MKYIYSFIITIIASGLLFADAVIFVKKTTYDYGSILEGEKVKITYKIPVKNSGDSPLKINKIRKTCGCTSIKYDTLIMPGETSIIQTEIDIRNRFGKLKKCITILSNAVNSKNFVICLESYIERIIKSSNEFIEFTKDKYELILSSRKKDLKISGVYFLEETRDYYKKVKSENDTRIDIDFMQTKLEKSSNNKLYQYKLVLTLKEQPTKENMHGKFIFVTNHPQKQELIIYGRLAIHEN
jgi:hypothetical protein